MDKIEFKLCEVSSFTKSKKIESFVGLNFTMDEKVTIGENFTMEFKDTTIKDKAVDVYKDKSGGYCSRLCLVGKEAVYIIELIEKVKK